MSPDNGRSGDALRDFIVETLLGDWCARTRVHARVQSGSHGGEETRFTFMALFAFACFFRADSNPPSVDLVIHLCVRVS